MKAGDVVKHHPSNETWVVAAVRGDGEHFFACGWPETMARIDDCTLVEECSSEDSIETLRKVARSDGARASAARANLCSLASAPDAGEEGVT